MLMVLSTGELIALWGVIGAFLAIVVTIVLHFVSKNGNAKHNVETEIVKGDKISGDDNTVVKDCDDVVVARDNVIVKIDKGQGVNGKVIIDKLVEVAEEKGRAEVDTERGIDSEAALRKVDETKETVDDIKEDYAVVRTFFATDRNLTGKTKPDEIFGVGRSSLTYGVCDVSIPRDHRMGKLEYPSIWRLEFREDPNKHVVLLNTAISSKDDFFADVAARRTRVCEKQRIPVRSWLQRYVRGCREKNGTDFIRPSFRRRTCFLQLAIARNNSRLHGR